jgi:DUF2950 family protein
MIPNPSARISVAVRRLPIPMPLVAALCLFVCSMLLAIAVGAATPKSAPAQRSFASPEEASAALVQAIRARDKTAIVAILGPGSNQWITSGDAEADRAAGERFVSQFDEKHSISADGDARATLTVGSDDWPFAFPLVRAGQRWRFDTEAGKEEMLARRIGQNELAVINVMLAIVDAQREYASADRNKDGVREYASKFKSSPGKQDGLYWPTASGEPPSPLGPLVVQAASEGYSSKGGNDESRTYHGYHFRLLTGQGSHAKGGAFDYIAKGHMIGGFAAIAYPARYENSGVMTFIVNHEGVVYQRDLGPDTAAKARAITRFDPGPGWAPTSTE